MLAHLDQVLELVEVEEAHALELRADVAVAQVVVAERAELGEAHQQAGQAGQAPERGERRVVARKRQPETTPSVGHRARQEVRRAPTSKEMTVIPAVLAREWA